MDPPGETESRAVTASVKTILSSVSGRKEKHLVLVRRRKDQFPSAPASLPLFLQGLPGVPGEQGVPGPAGVQVRGPSLDENL